MQRNWRKNQTSNFEQKINVEVYAQHCCGCGECVAVCPTEAIAMVANEQGFLYPNVDREKCVGCKKCVQRCSFNSDRENKLQDAVAFAVKHLDAGVRAASRSGGIFTAVSDVILQQGGVIYGCALIDNKKAVHIRATTQEERNRLRGSKYIQSETYHIFKFVKRDVQNGKMVLFSGTSCQVNAIKDYCKDVDCSKLVLIDIVCHGVPSPKVWSDYLDYLCGNDKKITSVDFRDKTKFGWAEHQETVLFEDGTSYSGDIFKKLFYNHYLLRRDCFQCPFRSLDRVSDLTIADCWGIHEHYPEFDDNKGVSLVLLNTEKGKTYFEAAKNAVDALSVDITKLLQPPLRMNWAMPEDYSLFWQDYKRNRFSKIVKKYVYREPSIVQKVKNKIDGVTRILIRIAKRILRILKR